MCNTSWYILISYHSNVFAMSPVFLVWDFYLFLLLNKKKTLTVGYSSDYVFCFSFLLRLFNELSIPFWSNVGGKATLGRIHYCFLFFLFVDNGFFCSSLYTKSVSRLIDVIDFLSYLFLNCFKLRHVLYHFFRDNKACCKVSCSCFPNSTSQ